MKPLILIMEQFVPETERLEILLLELKTFIPVQHLIGVSQNDRNDLDEMNVLL